MLIRSSEPLFFRHVGKGSWREHDDASVVRHNEEVGCWQQRFLGGLNDLVNAASTLLADAHASHQSSERFVSRPWRRIQESLRGDKRRAGVRDLDTVRKD